MRYFYILVKPWRVGVKSAGFFKKQGGRGNLNNHEPGGFAMGYMTDGLTFNTLREGNVARLPTFKNKHGQLAHDKADGSDWSPAQWLQAVVGELGEYANKRKKFERGDLTDAEFLREAESELADVQIYLDILAFRLGVDLGRATMEKFNEVSVRVGSPIRIDANGWHHEANPIAANPSDGTRGER